MAVPGQGCPQLGRLGPAMPWDSNTPVRNVRRMPNSDIRIEQERAGTLSLFDEGSTGTGIHI